MLKTVLIVDDESDLVELIDLVEKVKKLLA